MVLYQVITERSASMTVPTMVSINQARNETGLSYEFLRSLIREGKITYIRTGKKFLINLEKLVEYLENGEQDEHL